MKYIIRDDIIALDTYVRAEVEFKDFLYILNQCGGYAFLEQVSRLSGDRYNVGKMIKAKLIAKGTYSNYHFIYLTDTALKYLHYREVEKDYSNVKKNNISANKSLTSKPTQKVLFASAIKFELYYKTINNKDACNLTIISQKEKYLLHHNFVIDVLTQDLESKKEELNDYERDNEKNRLAYESSLQMLDRLNKIAMKREELNDLHHEIKTKIEEINEQKSAGYLTKMMEKDKLLKMENELNSMMCKKDYLEKVFEIQRNLITCINGPIKKYESILNKVSQLETDVVAVEKQINIEKRICGRLGQYIKNLYDISKCAILEDLRQNKITLYIIDTGTFKAPRKYFEMLDNYCNIRSNGKHQYQDKKSLAYEFYIISYMGQRSAAISKAIRGFIEKTYKNALDAEGQRRQFIINIDFIAPILQKYSDSTKGNNEQKYIKESDVEKIKELQKIIAKRRKES